MEQYVRVIPFKVIRQEEEVMEVPKGVDLIQAPKMWNETKGKGIKIAVLDTGCDLSHADLKDRITGGRNFTDDDNSDPNIFKDYNGHGTHVAGTIAAHENDAGVIGVAPEADLLIVKVLNKDGSGQYEWIINGIHYAIEQNADIISMSLGGPADVPELHDAIKAAVKKNILVVCAAGNEGDGDDSTDEFAYPGCYNEVISVGAVNLERDSSEFTNSHNEIDLVAPGEEILSTFLNGKYATLSGTSMAAPHVSGALALIKDLANKQFERKLSEPELYAQLIRRTVPLGNSPKLEGNGLVYLTVPEHLAGIFDQKFKSMVHNAI
ncbi:MULTISPECIES: S8 family peptidase [Cytobacillus]|jgi:major intracellular serine protease|uniref:S8 family peptidase n=1 Tax=Cytobacillus pseudoceanisediminis TaxID=3051614 RepID=A0ABZ2ZPB7_9BACI|nr:S8 family peptidase [Cytobacillus oceanisediminis]EFV75745.1 intracellular serine protease [Bacillus sp. 2_A_57_CT2]MBU8728753.1 S8 family peptidase [Cytobacillus oceanisediminis]MCM3245712.1 S8 family peptidase [Cytobacillus oceanisediminis]MCM3404475.1 S8 family peptidase [Cytobacillus oceanisediminis]MDK7667971.1 S8 family peptidase [Cytobacillus oceanisediminis]